jgi:hypothetical protein
MTSSPEHPHLAEHGRSEHGDSPVSPWREHRPGTVELVVAHADLGVQGNRSTGGTKPATPWPIDGLLEVTDSKCRPRGQLGHAASPRPVRARMTERGT